jgi:transcription termination factor Rho
MAENSNIATGVLEMSNDRVGYLRQANGNYPAKKSDPMVSRDMIGRFQLRPGLLLTGSVGRGKRNRDRTQLVDITEINRRPVNDFIDCPSVDTLTVIDPQERFRLEYEGGPLSMRVLDIVTPVGKGQRALIVAPPRSGKTVLLQDIANALTTNHPEITLIVLLVDERPEEATDMRRTIQGEVVASNADQSTEDHVRLVRLMIEVAKRRVEMGEDVVVLLDSLTRLGRAFNKHVGTTGRTMSGGLDIRALEEPKRIFGAARNIENGGSLTIIATALIETNSRMDDVIFEEFKGTGNMELMLSRDMANYRIYPAVDIPRSGTRKEERFYDADTMNKINRVRRDLMQHKPREAMESLIQRLSHHKTNADFFAAMAK